MSTAQRVHDVAMPADRLPASTATWTWLRCLGCGRGLCRGGEHARVSLTPSATRPLEIKCRGCGVLNYLGAESLTR
jgi:hypothetical protein